MRFPVWKLTALIVLTVSSLTGATAQSQNSPRQFTVVMDAMNFGSMPKDARVGDVIIWDNRDTVQHTATARDGSFDVRLQPGQKGRTVLRKAGNLPIYCIYHPMMRTTMNVAAGN